MSVKFILKDISEEEQKKINKLLTFKPIANDQFRGKNSFRPYNVVNEGSVQMYFAREGIIRLPFYFSNIYYDKIFNQEKKYPTIFEDQNGKFCGKLLDHQIEAFKKSIAYLDIYRTVTIALYPSFGKTFLGTMLSWYYNLKTCVLVHRDNVGKSWLKTFKNYFATKIKTPNIKGNKSNKSKDLPDLRSKEFITSSLPNGEDDITWVDEKGRYNPNAKIFVVMDTRVKKLSQEVIKSIGMLIIDEAHLFCSKTRVEPILSFSPKYIIAETATPEKDNGMHTMIQSVCGTHHIKKISEKPYNFFLINTGIDIEIGQSKNIFTDLLNFQFSSEVRNNLTVDLLESNKNKKCMIVTKFKDHCKLLKEMIEKKDMEASELYGNIKNYQTKNILIGTGSKMGVGFDEANFCDDYDGRPSDLLIITYSFKSWSSFEQIRGRGMRSDEPNVIMFLDNNGICKRHFREIRKWVKETNGVLYEKKLKDIKDYNLESLKK